MLFLAGCLNYKMVKKVIFILLLICCALPIVTASMALIAGILFTVFASNPFPKFTSLYSKRFLHYSIIGLGFGLNISAAMKVTSDGFLLTIGTIALVFLLGWILGKLFKVDKESSVLISSGTAICGGSAIAAVSGILNSSPSKISLSIGIVFLLNAVALFTFPSIGHFFELSQYQFGMWSAIAIHDTSSVLGAAHAYGEEALVTATTLKLSRALWIIPLSILIALSTSRKVNVKFPWFILGFILSCLIASQFTQFQEVYSVISKIAKQLLVVCLFLIGTSINLKNFKSEGLKSLLFAIVLWVILTVLSLLVIVQLY